MKKLWRFIGVISYWLTLPLLFLYLRRDERTRVLLVHDDKILVVKGWLSSGKWGLPGGGVKRGEKAAEAAVRELKEETSIDLPQHALKEIGKFNHRQNGLMFEYVLFIGRPDKELHARPVQPEIVEAKWVDISKLNKRNSRETVMVALEQLRLSVK